MNIPVIFFHLGYQNYLSKTIRQAKLNNERVILLGDSNNSHLDVEHHDITKYINMFEDFNKIYRHMSANNPQLEYLCFIRWYILKNFLEENNIEKCFYFDSDIMLYSNMSEQVDSFLSQSNGFCVPYEQPEFRWSASGHNSFWTKQTLGEFCEFIFNTYASKEGINKLKQKWDHHVKNNQPGGICDMTLFWLFFDSKNGENIDILSDVIDGSTYDDNINSSDNRFKNEYRMKNNIKEVDWKDGKPYCYNLKLNKWIRFNTLHFQGETAKLLL